MITTERQLQKRIEVLEKQLKLERETGNHYLRAFLQIRDLATFERFENPLTQIKEITTKVLAEEGFQV